MMKQIIFITTLVLGLGFSVFAQVENSLCPKIEVSGGGIVDAGRPMTFVVNVTGQSINPNFEYEWKVSNGKITSGQGTSEITVNTNGLADATLIEAEVKIKSFYNNCPNTASEVGAITAKMICQLPMDEFGKLPRPEIRARVDALFITLEKEINAQLYIINYGTDEEAAAREKLIRSHAAFRKYNTNRLIFARSDENQLGKPGVFTRAWILMPGAQPPTP